MSAAAGGYDTHEFERHPSDRRAAMSLWSWVRTRFAGDPMSKHPGEADTPPDPQSAHSRATGGVSDAGASDTHSTTGTTSSQTFVGRASGDDPGDAGKTGAEVRAEQQDGSSGRSDTDRESR
jgi:hypothetical protein